MGKMKKIVPVLMAATLLITNVTPAYACTGVYVGSEASENGSTYMGRSEDIGDLYNKVFGVAPAKELAEDEVYEDTYGFSMKYSDLQFAYPNTTYSYTYVRDSYDYGETMQDEAGNYVGVAYAEAGQNEKGVAVSATVSTYYNVEAEAADPLVDTGLCEISIGSLLLGGAATAREGVELLGEIIATYGAGECNSIMISDANETWYFEIVSGHEYAAVKLPADKASVQPNIMLLGVIDVDDTENVVASANLITLAEENDFLETEDGKINVAKTYAEANPGKGQLTRYWQGMFYVNESLADAYDIDNFDMGVNPVPLLQEPAKQFTTLDVLHLLAYRGEGTEMDSNADEEIYAIANNRQGECHIFETRQDMPAELATIQWQAMADAEFSIYVPFYSALVTEVDAGYETGADLSEYFDDENWKYDVENEAFIAATEGSTNWNFQFINNLCYNNRENTAEAVKAFFEAYQVSLIEQQALVDEAMLEIYANDPAAAKVIATEAGKDLAAQVNAVSGAVLTELRAYLAGDQTEAFALSEDTLAMMPEYSVETEEAPEIAESEDADASENAAQETGEAQSAEEAGGVSVSAVVLVIVIIAIAAAAFVVIKKKNK